MKNWMSFFSGIGSALVLGILVFGSLAVSLIGNGVPASLAQNIQSAAQQPLTTLVDEPALDGSNMIPPEARSIFPLPPADCVLPTGWQPIKINPGDTVEAIALLYAISVERLMEANCMETASVVVGAYLYVPDLPPTPTATATPTPTEASESDGEKATKPAGDSGACGHPAGWVVYIVRAGDTLYKIGQLTNTTAATLQRANCLGSQTIIHPGDRLYVPFQPVITSFPTRPAYQSPTPTAIPTEIITTLPPTATEAPTATPVPTEKPKPPTKTSQPTDPPPPTEPPTEPPSGN